MQAAVAVIVLWDGVECTEAAVASEESKGICTKSKGSGLWAKLSTLFPMRVACTPAWSGRACWVLLRACRGAFTAGMLSFCGVSGSSPTACDAVAPSALGLQKHAANFASTEALVAPVMHLARASVLVTIEQSFA